MTEYRVVYRRDRRGHWLAAAAGVKRCRGRGKTLRLARRALRTAMAAEIEEPHAIDFLEDVRLPPPARQLLIAYWRARRKLQNETARAEAATRAVLEALAALKVNARDAADLLGIPAPKLQRLNKKP